MEVAAPMAAALAQPPVVAVPLELEQPAARELAKGPLAAERAPLAEDRLPAAALQRPPRRPEPAKHDHISRTGLCVPQAEKPPLFGNALRTLDI